MNPAELPSVATRVRALAARAGDAMRIVASRDLASVARAPRTIEAEVARAGARYRPSFGDLDAVSAQRLVEVSREALAGLTPRVVVNRGVDRWTVDMLERGSAFPTIFSGRTTGPVDAAQRAAAWVNMRSINIYGGEAPGSTIFGSVQFAPLGAAGRTRGVSGYGQVAFDLTPDVAARSTLTARDSFLGSARTAPWERMPEVVAERIARNHGFIDDARAPRTGYRSSVEAASAQDVAARRRELLDVLAGPREGAVEHVRAQLTSPLTTLHHHFIEAQVRGATLADITGWRLEPQAEVVRAAGLVHTPARLRGPASTAPDPAVLEQVRTAAAARGIAEAAT